MAKDSGPTIFDPPPEAPHEPPDPQPETPRTLVLWARPDQADLLAGACATAGVRVAAAGSPNPTDAAVVARRFDTHPIDDPRTLIAEAQADGLLIADPRPWVEAPDDPHAAAFAAAADRGVRLATLEPLAANTADLAHAGWLGESASAPSRLPMLLRFARSPEVHAIADIFNEFGGVSAVRSARLTWTGPPAAASLGARTLLAFDAIHTLLDDPESVAASYAPARAATAGRKGARPNLVGLAGELHVDARLPGGRFASCLLSDQDAAGLWEFTLFGESGVLRLRPGSIEWADPGGSEIDRLEVESAASDRDRLARALRSWLDPRTPAVAPMDTLACYAAAEAALLSARTSERERPETVRRLVGKS